MSLVLNTNINSLVAQNSLTSSGNQLATALQQLSSGLRINTAADDAAGFAIVQGITSQIGGLNQAAQNASNGVSLAQTAGGALGEITSDLQTMRDLAVESLNATNSSQDRTDLDQQFQQLSADIDTVAKTANFNGVNLLDGTFNGQVFQTGANVGQTVSVASIGSARTSALGLYTGASDAGITITSGAPANLTVTIGGVATNLGNVATDASKIVTAIQNANLAGLTVSAAATTATGVGSATTATALGTSTLTINGIAISVNNTAAVAGQGLANNEANAINAINAVSAETGVVASQNGTNVQLTSQSGANITFAFAVGSATAATAGDYGLTAVAATTTSTVSYSYVAQPGVSGAVVIAGAGLTANNTAIGSAGSSIAGSSVTSVANSNLALSAIDAALQQVAASGAQLGAYQNRFQAAITGLNTTATNLTAARSGIQDTDFASATSALSRAQILQQSSTAMVAQANTVPQNVLTLLQKLP
jgi:flagellin